MTRTTRDLMSPAPVCLAATESVSAAAKAMKEHGIGTVLVLADGRLDGIVTDRDIAVRVLAENRNPAAMCIGDICSTELALLGPDDVELAARLVCERAIRRIPVMQDGTPVGVVSISAISAAQPNV